MKTTLSLLTSVLIGLLAAGPAMAQQDPRLTNGQLPYVVVVLDTSASMEYTDEGNEEYPTRVGGSLAEPVEWIPGTYMEIGEGGQIPNGPAAFGSCIVWEPSSCDDYARPSWNAGQNIPPEWKPGYHISDGPSPVSSRFQTLMRGSTSARVRLMEDSQPRHVTMKEVLTGDMVLLPLSDPLGDILAYDPSNFGPGCWFVPRQRNASIQSNPNDPMRRDQNICGTGYSSTNGPFENYIDLDEPRPHFQEVYDSQLDNGLMDSLSTTTIFAVAGFDGYRNRASSPGWNDRWSNSHLNDAIDNTLIPDPTGSGFRGSSKWEDASNCDGLGGPRCYDLGIYRVMGPQNLQIPQSLLPEVSAFTQIMIKDSGYLTTSTDQDLFELTADESDSASRSFMGATFSAGLDNYLPDYWLGRQPVARATPIAAAMHDLHGFFADGQAGSSGGGNSGAAPTLPPSFGRNNNDEGDQFAECRPKHVVLMTDGQPDPERDGDTFNAAFGYDPINYVYSYSEDEIAAMVNDSNNLIPPAGAGFDPEFGVRVHIVGLNIASDPVAIQKLHDMARVGETCVGHFLNASWKTTSGGTCDPMTEACLVPDANGAYPYVASDGTTHNCEHPALVLTANNRDRIQQALSEIFNGIVGASSISSRTRAVITNRLDDPAELAGGQYRFLSGIRVDGSPHWKGILNRQGNYCDGASPAKGGNISLNDEIARQVDLTTAQPSDSRRVFTSIPAPNVYDFQTQAPVNFASGSAPSGVDAFPIRWDYVTTGFDEFQGSQVASGPPLVGSRIPFEHANVTNAYTTAGSPNFGTTYSYFNTAGQNDLQEVINVFRARVPLKMGDTRGGSLVGEEGRVLGGFLNANPVVVGPPILDVPVESYRSFRTKHGRRNTMAYVQAMNGLLHAVHTGENDGVRVREMKPENGTPSTDAQNGTAEQQREAWAYLPHSLHRRLSNNRTNQPYFFDGTPVVKDVRVCRPDQGSNQHPNLCYHACGNGDCAPDEQWRTVLVQSAGLAGEGYAAVDVTRPGGSATDAAGATIQEMPDPIPMWEFNRAYESVQVRYMSDARVSDAAPSSAPNCPAGGPAEYQQTPMLGMSLSQPEIATVVVEYLDAAGASKVEQRAVAVFGAGRNLTNVTGCGSDSIGRAVYVVDLQTGNILRRFTGTNTQSFAASDLDAQFVGSPALFSAATGVIATRGYIGDQKGRMFKMDFTDTNPANWDISLFYDVTNGDADTAKVSEGFVNEQFGPAMYKPALVEDKSKRVTVIWGLGEIGDTNTNGQVQAVLSVRDDPLSATGGTTQWVEVLELGEKLTGEPIVFNASAYFPTYAIPTADVCEPGLARIYGVHYQNNTLNRPIGIFQNNANIVNAPVGDILTESDASPDIKWFGPTQPTLIRGLTISFENPCNVDTFSPDGTTINDTGTPQPTLTAQTSGNDVTNSFIDTNTTGFSDATTTLDVGINMDQPVNEPLSWSVLNN